MVTDQLNETEISQRIIFGAEKTLFKINGCYRAYSSQHILDQKVTSCSLTLSQWHFGSGEKKFLQTKDMGDKRQFVQTK